MSTSALITALRAAEATFRALPSHQGRAPADAIAATLAEATAPVPESDARQQARAQVESIVALVAALNCDYDRLEELRELRDEGGDHGPEAFVAQHPAEAAELADLEAAAGDYTSREQAEDRIREDALSVEVRSGWQTAGETLEPSEFRIVLCTGGPHVEIRGELDENNEPSRAWIAYQDWNENGELTGNQDDLLAYAACFYFGE